MRTPVHHAANFVLAGLIGGTPAVLWLWATNRRILTDRPTTAWKTYSLLAAAALGFAGGLGLFRTAGTLGDDLGFALGIERGGTAIVALAALWDSRDARRRHPPLPTQYASNVGWLVWAVIVTGGLGAWAVRRALE